MAKLPWAVVLVEKGVSLNVIVRNFLRGGTLNSRIGYVFRKSSLDFLFPLFATPWLLGSFGLSRTLLDSWWHKDHAQVKATNSEFSPSAQYSFWNEMSSWGSLILPSPPHSVKGWGRRRNPSLTCRVTKSPECLSQGLLLRIFLASGCLPFPSHPYVKFHPSPFAIRKWMPFSTEFRPLMDALGGCRETLHNRQSSPSWAVTPWCHSSQSPSLQYPAHL